MKLDAMAYRADWDKLFQVTLSSSSILHVSWFAHSIAPDRVSQLFEFPESDLGFLEPHGAREVSGVCQEDFSMVLESNLAMSRIGVRWFVKLVIHGQATHI